MVPASMSTLTVVLLACAAFAVGFCLLGIYSTLRHTSRRAARVDEAALPPLSLLKPIKGLEEELEGNLRSFFEQVYPGELEFVFSGESYDDPGLVLARAIAADYPHVPTRFVLCDLDFGLNPKVANLAAAYRAAKHELVLQSDANVRARPGYLESIVREMIAADATLLSSIVVGTGESSIGAALENLQLTAFIGPAVCTALHVAGVSVVIGKSMLMRRSAIDDLGGLEMVRDILTEDFILGRRVQESGRRIVLSTFVLENVNREIGVDRFFARHSRWLKMRAVIHFGSFLADLFANPTAFTFFAFVSSGFDATLGALFGATAVVKTALDAFYVKRLRGTPMALHHLALGPLKDLCMAVMWPYCAVSRSVVWRGRKLRFGTDSRLFPDPGTPIVRLARRLVG